MSVAIPVPGAGGDEMNTPNGSSAAEQAPVGLIRGVDGIWRDRLAAKFAEAERVPGLEVEMDRLRSQLTTLTTERLACAAQVAAFERDWQGNPAAIIAGLQAEVARLSGLGIGSDVVSEAIADRVHTLAHQLGGAGSSPLEKLVHLVERQEAELVKLRAERDMRALGLEPPEIRRLGDGAIDEIVARGVNVHLEMMDRDFVWLGIYGPGGEQLHVDVTAVIPSRRKRPVIRIVTSADSPEVDGAKCTRSKR